MAHEKKYFMAFAMTRYWFLLALITCIPVCSAAPATCPQCGDAPQAHRRTHAQNYKDMALAGCITRAYDKEQAASSDASATFSALREWTVYDLDNSPKAMDQLWRRYLNRDYHYPIPDEYKNVQFKLLKCLDMYHSKELDAQVKRFVLRPNHTFAQDHPALKR